jgi:glyoxylase-like metal-dependent hydrolase (beta-lactamase superfamily II)
VRRRARRRDRPAPRCRRLSALARENDLTIAYVLETHRQEDFEFGSRTLAKMTGARIVSGSHALFGMTDVKLEDGEELEVGTTRIVALATPGHTPESMSYAVYVEDAGDKCWGVFTGDALFVGDTGRTDLPDPGKPVRTPASCSTRSTARSRRSATRRCSIRRMAPAPRAAATYRRATTPPSESKKARTRCS